MNKFYLILYTFIFVLLVSLYILYNNYQNIKNDYYISVNNEKALNEENCNLNNRILEYKFTVEHLNNSKDSLYIVLNNARKELKIKDTDIKRLEYLASTAKRTDTLYIKDTIFKDPTFSLDTIKKEQWYSLQLKLSYPNRIEVTPEFKSDKYIITHLKKETINPPKKCKLARWFQRKHKVVEVEIIENNPYIETSKSKFIEIIK